jgi:hypothetical protein
VNFPWLAIPAIRELARRDAWCCWRAVRRGGKSTKVPFTPAGSTASSTDPRTWSSFTECFAGAYVAGRHHGIGRVLVGGEGLVGIDLDSCTSTNLPFNSYTEVSPSGNGLHIWVRGHWPVPGSKRAGIEVYASKRFLTITGAHLDGTPEDIRHVDLAPLWERLQPRHAANRACTTDLDFLRQRLGLPDHPPEPIDVGPIAQRHPQLRRILQRQYASQSERDLAVVRFAHMAGRSPALAWALLRALRTDRKAERPDYVLRTLGRIYAP